MAHCVHAGNSIIGLARNLVWGHLLIERTN